MNFNVIRLLWHEVSPCFRSRFVCLPVQQIPAVRCKMALSKYEYVKSFENEDKLEPLHWIVVHIKLQDHKEFLKGMTLESQPENVLSDVMVSSGINVLEDIREIALGYGYKNVFSFVFKKHTNLYSRRSYKLLSYLTSSFSSYFANKWPSAYSSESKTPPTVPVFEGFLYLFPHDQCLRDFLTREQKFCHEINLRETTFWNLVHKANFSYSEASEKIANTSESDKNELLFSLCKLNYNNEPPKAKKGSILLPITSKISAGEGDSQKKFGVTVVNEDFHKNQFWEKYFPLDVKTKESSKFNLLESFQRKIKILPHAWLVVRIDGKGFHKFSMIHNFRKPNDQRSLNLMTACAASVSKEFPFIIFCYGQSDEYSFIIKRYGNRQKEALSLISKIVSKFTGTFVSLWNDKSYFEGVEMLCHPCFDARLVIYPTSSSLRDYVSWRQVDCHINNMYNTCFWALVLNKGLSRQEAEIYLKNTFSQDKLRILKEEFDINYYEMDPQYLKGTLIMNNDDSNNSKPSQSIEFIDLIGDGFWTSYKNLFVEWVK